MAENPNERQASGERWISEFESKKFTMTRDEIEKFEQGKRARIDFVDGRPSIYIRKVTKPDEKKKPLPPESQRRKCHQQPKCSTCKKNWSKCQCYP